MIQIKAPDGSIAQFPDGTDDATITKVMAQEYGGPKPQASSLMDAARSIPGGLAKGVSAIAGLPGDVDRGLDSLANAVVPGLGDQRGANVAGLPDTGQISDAVAKPFGGFYQPQTTAGKYAETIASFAPAAIAPGGIAARTARVLVPGTASETAGQLTAGTKYEPLARAAGGIAGGVATAMAPGASEYVSRLLAGSGPTDAARIAHEAGYVLPPNMASEKPGPVSDILSAVGGKVKTQQAASAKNQTVTNNLVKADLGLPDDAHLTPDVLEGVREDAGKSYEAVRKAPIEVINDPTFKKDVSDLGQIGEAARREAPGLVRNADIDQLSEALAGIDKLSPDATVDIVRSLRYKARANLKNYSAPEKMDLGRAQSRAATALEGLLERNLQAATTARSPIGTQGGDMNALVDSLRSARQTIAKTHDVEKALVGGDVDAKKLAGMLAKRKPLTDGMKTAAEFAAEFPKAAQTTARVGGQEKLSVVDVLAAGLSHLKTAGVSLARPATRGTLLSAPYQGRMMRAAKDVPSGISALPNSYVASLLSLPHAVRKEDSYNRAVNSADQ